MKAGVLEEVAQLATKAGYVFITTADADKYPHLAVARTMVLKGKGKIAVREWFCPGTIANLQSNSHVSIVVWDKDSDTGYQLLGEMEHMMDTGMTDGYIPKIESKQTLPQVERQLLIRVNKVIDFKRAPHSDIEE